MKSEINNIVQIHMIAKKNCSKAVYETWNQNLGSNLNFETKFGMKISFVK